MCCCCCRAIAKAGSTYRNICDTLWSAHKHFYLDNMIFGRLRNRVTGFRPEIAWIMFVSVAFALCFLPSNIFQQAFSALAYRHLGTIPNLSALQWKQTSLLVDLHWMRLHLAMCDCVRVRIVRSFSQHLYMSSRLYKAKKENLSFSTFMIVWAIKRRRFETWHTKQRN